LISKRLLMQLVILMEQELLSLIDFLSLSALKKSLVKRRDSFFIEKN